MEVHEREKEITREANAASRELSVAKEMTTIPVKIEWLRQGEPFTDNQYSRAHRWTFDGGTEVLASSSPHFVPVPMSDVMAVDPEEAFVASLSSCHMLWFLSIAAKKGLRVNRYLDLAEGRMDRNEAGKLVMLEVRLRPDVEFEGEQPNDVTVAAIHHSAHDECFIANSVRTKVTVELK